MASHPNGLAGASPYGARRWPFPLAPVYNGGKSNRAAGHSAGALATRGVGALVAPHPRLASWPGDTQLRVRAAVSSKQAVMLLGLLVLQGPLVTPLVGITRAVISPLRQGTRDGPKRAVLGTDAALPGSTVCLLHQCPPGDMVLAAHKRSWRQAGR